MGILEENYSPIAHGMVLSNPLVAEVAGHYGDSSFFPSSVASCRQ